MPKPREEVLILSPEHYGLLRKVASGCPISTNARYEFDQDGKSKRVMVDVLLYIPGTDRYLVMKFSEDYKDFPSDFLITQIAMVCG